MKLLILIFLVAIGVTVFLIGARKKKISNILCGTICVIAVIGFYIYSQSYSSRTKESVKAFTYQLHAEAYGVAQTVKEMAGGKQVVVFGCLEEKDMAVYIDILKNSGIAHAQYLRIYETPIRLSTAARNEAIINALKKVPDAEVIVASTGVNFAPAFAEILSRNFKIIQVGNTANKELLEKGIFAAYIKTNPEVPANRLSSDPAKAFLQGFEVFKK